MIKEYCDSCGCELQTYNHRIVLTFKEYGGRPDHVHRKIICRDCWEKIREVLNIDVEEEPIIGGEEDSFDKYRDEWI